MLDAQVGEIEPRVEQTNQQFEEAAAAQRAAERNLRQLHSKVENTSYIWSLTSGCVTCCNANVAFGSSRMLSGGPSITGGPN